MKTVDDEILSNALCFVDKARKENKPFFVWLDPTRMHVFTHLSEKYEKMRTPENGWTIEEAGTAQLDRATMTSSFLPARIEESFKKEGL